MTPEQAREELRQSIAHWESLAMREELFAKRDREEGRDLSLPGRSPGDYRARTYRDVAKALRLELETGRPHCSACFGPHPNHEHGHRG